MVARDTDIDERVAILKRLRETLLSQRDKFVLYMQVLEQQELDIREGDTSKLGDHMDLEQAVVSELVTFQRVISPLQDMYRAAYPQRENEIPQIEASIEKLKERVLERNQKNRDLLRESIGHLRKKILDIRANRKLGPLFTTEPEPTLIDITT